MKISKRVREEAAMLCAIAASAERYYCLVDIQHMLGIRQDEDVWFLAASAFHSNTAKSFYVYDQARYAEAESLLRCGWSPGDEP